MFKVLPHDPRSLRWWYEQFLLLRIDMAPKYQRKADVWSKWKRSHLIDSILNDFDIPKFYVANFYAGGIALENPTSQGYAIIDGKQRFGAIFDFFSDKVKLNPSFALEDEPSLRIGSLTYSELRTKYPSLCRKVDDFIPTVMNVMTDDESRIEQLFVRLNMGEATTAAERRNAMGGPVPVITRELCQHSFFVKKAKFDTKRMQEFNLANKLLFIEYKGGFVDTKASNIDQFTAEALKWSLARPEDQQDDMGEYEKARDRVFETLELLATEFEDKDPLLSKSSEIPIYYWIARQHPKWVNELRDFVSDFSAHVLENFRSQRDLKPSDSELNAYYTAGRTSNDQGSMQARYKIFERRFESYRRPGGRKNVR